MLKLSNGFLVQHPSELPSGFEFANRLFLDVETRSGDPKRSGDSPFHGDRICGFSVTIDDNPDIYYIPIRHKDRQWNLPMDSVLPWLRKVVSTAKVWINHNVIFDAHFCSQEGAEFTGELHDTLTLSKLHDSDRMSYGLKSLFVDWLNLSKEEQDSVAQYLESAKSKDFADVPADILGDYACKDVRGNRLLYKFLLSKKPTDNSLAWDNEIKLTPVLYDIEKDGMRVDKTELQIETLKSLQKQIMFGDALHKLSGQEVNPNSNKQIYDLLCNNMSLPVMKLNEESGNPSFDSDAFEMYLIHPEVLADERKLKTIQLLQKYREEVHFMGLFLNPYSELNVDGWLHPSYNQCVRTGRMACRNPNAQQLNSRAKGLIHPPEGYGILSCDYSQIEFRLICHYIKDVEAIKAYNADPTTDFHQWVADMCGVKRKAAKCLNFGMGFGAGKKKVIKMLSSDPSVIEDVSLKINKMIEDGVISAKDRIRVFNIECQLLAEHLYNTYHERLPGIKQTSYRASDIAKRRGYVFNLYGRRRHLLPRFCYRGFNSVIQSCAADVIKDCVVKLSPRYNKKMRDVGLKIFALVHDDCSSYLPLEAMRDCNIVKEIKSTLEDSTVKFDIPIVMDVGFSEKSWADAGLEEPVLENGRQISGPYKFE